MFVSMNELTTVVVASTALSKDSNGSTIKYNNNSCLIKLKTPYHRDIVHAPVFHCVRRTFTFFWIRNDRWAMLTNGMSL